MSMPNELLRAAKLVVEAINKTHGQGHDYIPEIDIADRIDCPVCRKGIMEYTISAYNGHRSAQCSTGCFGYYVE
jgi:hypothetical protein